jgi:glycerophosphoryl diester phosphodiesterase
MHYELLGKDMEKRLVQILHKFNYHTKPHLAFIQSFETTNLKRLSKVQAQPCCPTLYTLTALQMTPIPLIFLIESHGVQPDTNVQYIEMLTPEQLSALSKFVAGIGPPKSFLDVTNTTEGVYRYL